MRILLCVLCTFLMVQIGNGQDTILYNLSWKPKEGKNYHYYRIYKEVDSLIYVEDFFKSGELQMSGYFQLPKDSNITAHEYFMNDDTEDGRVGKFVYYNKDHSRYRVYYHYPFEKDLSINCDSLMDATFLDSIPQGLVYFKIYHKNSIVSEGFMFGMESYELHGIFIKYYVDGRIAYLEEYQNGEYHGTATRYFTDGSVMQINNYIKGKKDGEQIYYDRYGDPKLKKEYKDGKLLFKAKIYE